jgi:hypothetical protein
MREATNAQQQATCPQPKALVSSKFQFELQEVVNWKLEVIDGRCILPDCQTDSEAKIAEIANDWATALPPSVAEVTAP